MHSALKLLPAPRPGRRPLVEYVVDQVDLGERAALLDPRGPAGLGLKYYCLMS
jgi:hypothetical protein